MNHLDVYQIVTDRIIEKLAQGTTPWRQPWMAQYGGGLHKNLVSGKPYRGVNQIMTLMSGFASPYWVTFNQAKTLGGNVKKGAKGTPIVFWNLQKRQKTDAKTGETVEQKIPFLKYFTVFNVEQTEGLTVPEAPVLPTISPIEAAEAAVASWRDKPGITHGGDRAYYSPLTDTVTLPVRGAFVSSEAYYGTLFHELTHSTGADSRLKRFQPTAGQFVFGSTSYSQEELVAEIGSSFIAARLGLTLDEANTTAYLAGWLKRLRDDKKFIFHAARDAQKATDLILGTIADPTEVEPEVIADAVVV